VARRAWQRPVDLNHGVLAIIVPPDLPLSRFLVAKAVALEVAIRLHRGNSVDHALKVACGIDFIVRRLEFMGIAPPHRSTVRRALDDLAAAGVVDFVGQLDGWYDREAEQVKKGAYVYAPSAKTLRAGLAGSVVPIVALSRTRLRTGPETCLRWAIENAQPGERNNIGHWLTCRCTDAGLTEGETMRVMTEYQKAVGIGPWGADRYTQREAAATVGSRFRRLAAAR
jgi:hypothetical protein